MSLVKTNAAQIGQSVTATNNFTMYQPSSPDGTVRWGVGNSGSVTDIVTLNSSGNVGIGTSSPSTLLHIYKNANSGGNIWTGNTVRTYQIGLTGATSGEYLLYDITNSQTAYSYLNTQGHIFYTNNSERMRIDSSGNWMLGKTVTTITTVGVSALTNGRVMIANAASTAADDGFQIYSTGASAYRFYVSMAGVVYATSTTISAISDQRYKENIRDLDVGLDAVMALKPRVFDWKAGKGKDIKNDRGFIAQEFEQVFPDLIDEWKDPAPEGEERYKSVRQDLIPVLVKAIQELNAKLDAANARIEQLEAK